MIFGQLSYLATVFIFAGGAFLIELLSQRKEMKPYARFLLFMCVCGVFYTIISEPPATSWGAWEYNPQQSLNIHIFGAELETYFFTTFVILAVSGATMVLAEDEERGLPLIPTIGKRFRRALRIGS